MWEQTANLGDLLGPAHPRHVLRPLLALAAGCLRRVSAGLAGPFPGVPDLLERGDVAALDRVAALLPADLPETTDRRDLAAAGAVRLLAAAARAGTDRLRAAVGHLARGCREAEQLRLTPDRPLTSFPLPAHLEPYRAGVVNAFRFGPHGGDPYFSPAGREAYQHLTRASADYQREQARVSEAEATAQCDLARDIFGYPDAAVRFDPDWRTSTAAAVARGMWEAADFSGMPILADALQDAGCDDPEVLGHCRSEAPHARGCWVVDLVLDTPPG
jgi:hypothetical protein